MSDPNDLINMAKLILRDLEQKERNLRGTAAARREGRDGEFMSRAAGVGIAIETIKTHMDRAGYANFIPFMNEYMIHHLQIARTDRANGQSKIEAIKILRVHTGMGLKDAKDVIEAVDLVRPEAVSFNLYLTGSLGLMHNMSVVGYDVTFDPAEPADEQIFTVPRSHAGGYTPGTHEEQGTEPMFKVRTPT